METLDKRSETRQPLQQPVSLHGPDAEQPVVGKTRNLSSRGMCVFMTPTPSVGQELSCELPNGQAVRGRVAWATEPNAADLDAWSGVGIEFADRSPMDIAAMRAQGEEPLSSTPAPVDVWFDGLESSTRAIAQRRDGAVELSSTLAFLREGSDVRIAASKAEGAEPLRGKVANVFLRSDGGTPRLVITLALTHEVITPPAPGDERWFPEISIDDQPVVATRADEPTASLEARSLVARSMDTAVPESLEPDVTERNPVAEPVVDGDRRLRTVRMIAFGTVAFAIALWATLRSDAPRPAEPVALEAAAPVAVAAAPEEAEVAPAPSAREENIAAESPHAEFASAELKHKGPKPAEVPVETAPHVAPVAAAAMPAAAPHVAPTADASGPGWLPQVVTVGDQQQLTVPLGGTGKGITRFLLDSPPGIAVDLPAAFPVVPMKSYLLHDPAFYSLWIRKQPNGNGLQIRLHVTKGVHVSAEIVDGKLRFKRKD